MLANILREAWRRARRPAPTGTLAGDIERVGDLLRSGRAAEALVLAQRSLCTNPRRPELHHQVAVACLMLGDLAGAQAAARCSLEIRPEAFATRVLLGAAYQRGGLPSAALEQYAHAVALNPGDADALGYAGNMQLQLGRHQEALDSYRRALALQPGNAVLNSNLLLAMNSVPNVDREALYRAHRQWGAQLERDFLDHAHPAPADPDPERSLRVGYVSADFREHSVAYFIEPIWSRIERSRYATFVYDNFAGEPDSVATRLAAHADRWCRTAALSDEQLAARVQADRIDILVDLSGHTAGNRLPVFARKPVPVQATWFAYMNTTGLTSIQYRITDCWLTPPGTERFYSERLLRLTACACWAPAPDCPPVGEPPFASTGRVSFGSFNNWTKVTPQVIAAWSRILSGVPGSRLVALLPGGGDPAVRAAVASAFGAHSVAPERLDIRATRPLGGFLETFGEVDIALDSFPYTGGTTTLHTLWMGVPVIAMQTAGETGRTGGGILAAIGAEDLL
ncbi:MAG: tetratricopeptide repeat protein, partial [Burkholderiales bacterium]|nr:tetratricopeptide repeat protein [Burkholderiales bacterium]